MPYTYLDKAYITAKHDVRVIVQLTNDDSRVDSEDPRNVNETVLQIAENDAAQTVDNHLRDLYDLPLLPGTTLTSEIKGIVAALTWCNLWERRGEEGPQVTALRKRMLERLDAMAKPGATETRGAKNVLAAPVRSTRGKERTMFDDSGYFDGLKFRGRRTLAGDSETSGTI
jgi:hypothetical protein